MKLAICDDDKKIREIIAESVSDVSEEIDIAFYSDAKGILAEDFNADILFLDIQMPEIDGMTAAKLLRKKNRETIIVFVTAVEEEVFNAFDVGAFQYIVKPFSKEKLREIIKKTIAEAERKDYIKRVLSGKSEEDDKDYSIVVKSGGIKRRVKACDIVYAEIFDRQIILHMSELEKIEYYGRISELERIIGNNFFRVHRAYLINLKYVKSYDSKLVNLMGEEIPVARGKYQELVKAILSYHTRIEKL